MSSLAACGQRGCRSEASALAEGSRQVSPPRGLGPPFQSRLGRLKGRVFESSKIFRTRGLMPRCTMVMCRLAWATKTRISTPRVGRGEGSRLRLRVKMLWGVVKGLCCWPQPLQPHPPTPKETPSKTNPPPPPPPPCPEYPRMTHTPTMNRHASVALP